MVAEEKLAALHERLRTANAVFDAMYPGANSERQPVHTVYGGAQLYSATAATKLGTLARRHLAEYAPHFTDFARVLDFHGAATLPTDHGLVAALEASYAADPQAVRQTNPAAWLAATVHARVFEKLGREAVEDHRVDFEDGYGSRSDAEEDGHARAAADAMASAWADGTLPAGVGLRIKSLSEEARERSLRTLALFVDTLAAHGRGLPPNFVVTLPKVTHAEQVAVLVDFLDLLEADAGVSAGSIRIELMIETIQSLFEADGRSGIPALITAGKGRVRAAILGTFDYTATCNIASAFQSHRHPAADFARMMMQASLTGTEVTISDGITNVMPVPVFRPGEEALDLAQIEANRAAVHGAWKLHFDNISHSLQLGIYQGWDLNPAQIPIRYAAVYYFFLTGLADATARLKTFIDQAAQASMVGNVFDDAASAQGILNYFVAGISCGALTEAEALATGITMAELRARSFRQIVENRVQADPGAP